MTHTTTLNAIFNLTMKSVIRYTKLIPEIIIIIDFSILTATCTTYIDDILDTRDRINIVI